MNRRKEIALLLTMGASIQEIKKTFLYLGNLIGISGMLCGCTLAAIILFILSNFSPMFRYMWNPKGHSHTAENRLFMHF